MSNNYEFMQQMRIGLTGSTSARETTVRAVAKNKTSIIAEIPAELPPALRAESLKLVQRLFLTSEQTPPKAVVFAAIDSGNGCTRLLDGGDRLLVVRIRLLETLERGVLIGGEPAVAHDIEPGSRDLGLCRGDLGFGLRDHRFLQATGRVEIGESGLLGGNRRIRPRQSGAIIPVVEFDQQIPGAHCLIVGDCDLGDETGDFRRDYRHVAADIGIVGALDETPDRPPLMAVPCGAGSDQKCEAKKPEPSQVEPSDRPSQITVRRGGRRPSLSRTDVEFGYGAHRTPR